MYVTSRSLKRFLSLNLQIFALVEKREKKKRTLDRCLYWSHDSLLFFLSEIIVRVHLNTGKKPNPRCRGDILQIDAQITFRTTALSGLKRFSVDQIKNEDYVSQEKVVVEKLKRGKTVLLFEGIDKCLRFGIFLKYYRKTGLLALGALERPIKRLYEVHYAESSTGKNAKLNGINVFQATDGKKVSILASLRLCSWWYHI